MPAQSKERLTTFTCTLSASGAGAMKGVAYNCRMLDLKVPNVNERDRTPEEAIRAVVEHIARQFDPDKIILFGSYAYGDLRPWSDVDLLVVMDAPEGELTPAL